MTSALRGSAVLLLAAGLGFAATYRPAARESAPAATPSDPVAAPAAEVEPSPPVAPAAETVCLPPAIDARFWGVVLDRERAPVAGARVTAVPHPDPPPLSPVPSLEECREHLERVRLARERHTVEVTTSGDGTFDLGGLIAATYEVVAVSPGGERTLPERAEPGWYLELRTPRGEPQVVEIVLTGGRALQSAVIVEFRGETAPSSVEVIDPPEVNIQAPGRGRGSRLVISADDPASLLARLEPGVEVRSRAGGRSTPWAEILPETERISLAFPLESTPDPRALLEVHVAIPPGEARQVEWVGALEIVPGAPPIDEARFLRAARWSRGSGEDGLLQLRPGRAYRVGAALGPVSRSFFNSGEFPRGPAHLDVEGATFLGEEGARLEFAVAPILDAEESLVVELRTSGAGAPPAAPRFTIYVSEAGKRLYEHCRSTRARDGRYVLDGLSPRVRAILDGAAEGEIEIEVTDRELGVRSARLGRSSPRTVAIDLPAPARLELEFTTPLPTELRGALRFMKQDGKGWTGIAFPEWEGERAVFARFPAGESALRVSARELHLLDLPVSPVSGGTSVVPVAIEELHSVRFAGDQSIRGLAEIVLADGREVDAPSDAGAAIWLPAGTHRLVLRPGGEVRFQVPAAEPIEWRKP